MKILLRHSFDDKPARLIAGAVRKGVISYPIKVWYHYGERHRDNDKPAVVNRYFKYWYQKGKLHRYNDKPAIERTYANEWYWYGKRHRENNQPAIMVKKLFQGERPDKYYLNDVEYFP